MCWSARALLAKLLATRKAEYPLGSRPTVVLTRGDERNVGREASHAALAKLSNNFPPLYGCGFGARDSPVRTLGGDHRNRRGGARRPGKVDASRTHSGERIITRKLFASNNLRLFIRADRRLTSAPQVQK